MSASVPLGLLAFAALLLVGGLWVMARLVVAVLSLDEQSRLPMYQRILIAVDGSDTSYLALGHAVQLAQYQRCDR